MSGYGYSTASGSKSSSTQISVGPGALSGVDVSPPDSGHASLIIYDSENSSTTDRLILVEVHVDAGFTGVNHEFFSPVAVNRGIYATLTGTSATFNIRYLRG